MGKIRVLVVDDAVVVRRLVSDVLSSEPDIEVVGAAANGRIALNKLPQVNPDVITLDLEMPEMDGLETLAAIRRTYPRLPVIIFSTLSERGAAITLDALALGANDYVTKPHGSTLEETGQRIREELLPRIRVLCPDAIRPEPLRATGGIRMSGTFPRIEVPTRTEAPQRIEPHSREPQRMESYGREPHGSGGLRLEPSHPHNVRSDVTGRGDLSARDSTRRTDSFSRGELGHLHRHRIEVLAIGVSTGGPNALASLLPELPADFPVPVVIVQHMPPLFTRLLAERLDSKCALTVREGVPGGVVEPGSIWIAPGNFHMTLERDGNAVRLHLNQEPPENSSRPALDAQFRSVVQVYGGRSLGVVLTGMGQDGLRGSELIHAAGGQVLAQDEPSSVVWGMPGFVARAGLADKVLPLNRISAEIMHRVSEGRSLRTPTPMMHSARGGA